MPLVGKLLKDMGFSLEQDVNYDPHQIISKRRKPHKCKPFEHSETPGLKEVANWDDFPNSAAMDVSIGQSSVSPLPWVTSPQRELSKVVEIAGNTSLLVSYSGSSMKRGFPEPMETEEVDTTSMPKRQKIEQEQQLVQVKRRNTKGQMKKKNVEKKQKKNSS